MDNITAPFTDEQVLYINEWQEAGFVHPLTCHKGHKLLATTEGMICSGCQYKQNWVPWETARPDVLTEVRKNIEDLLDNLDY